MEKILINLSVPAVNKSFDLFAPLNLEIAELTKILVKGVEYLSEGDYISSNEEMLNFKNTNLPLNPSLTLFSYCAKDGAEIVLL